MQCRLYTIFSVYSSLKVIFFQLSFFIFLCSDPSAPASVVEMQSELPVNSHLLCVPIVGGRRRGGGAGSGENK